MHARFASLQQWLDWQQTLSAQGIVLGLERVAAVAGRLGLERLACPVITVAGTNGKGSVVAMLEAMLLAAGYRVGAYTSPHLLRYNERVRIDGEPVADAPLIEAFAAIDAARGELALTYFEFGTLAALHVFQNHPLDVVLLEVGLGGRLDAVNVVDADVAVITSIDIDHAEWLGHDREAIGREKAGIMRAGRPAVCGDRRPPRSLLRHARSLGARLRCIGREFEAVKRPGGLLWKSGGRRFELPLPALPGEHQIDNAATALAALAALEDRLPLDAKAMAEGLRALRLPGRYQCLAEAPRILADVAHNPQAARALAANLRADPVPGRTLAVFSALADKDIAGIIAPLRSCVDHWCIAGLDVPRGLEAEALARRVASPGLSLSRHPRVPEALAAARAMAGPDDRIVVFGSFLTVAAALASGL